MKSLFSLFILFSSTSLQAAGVVPVGDTITDNTHTQLAALTHNKKGLKRLGGILCNNMKKYGDDFADKSIRTIKKYMTKKAGYTNPSVKDVILFMNQHKDDMVCTNNLNETKNYMMTAIDLDKQVKLFNGLFLSGLVDKVGSTPYIDINAVTCDKGRCFTVYDYMQMKWKETKNNNNLLETHLEIDALMQRFRNDFDAKRFDELDADTRAKYLNQEG